MDETTIGSFVQLAERHLLPALDLVSIDPGDPVRVLEAPEGFQLLGAGNYAAVFTHRDYSELVIKVYAPGRGGWEDEREVYGRLGRHPAYSACYAAGEKEGLRYLVLKRLRGKTMYQCMLDGEPIPESVIEDIDEALDYARGRGLHPHDVHGKNVMVSGGKGLVVDVSDFLKTEPCMMWDDLKRAYERIYVPFMGNRPFPVPEWVMNGVRKGYRWIRQAALDGRSS
ncbi:serine/threonine protein kinase [Paenibacillus thailandensis]|uniref:Serine/threonine protein kinase n=1 Tax=Paenibacillus thailandensis TaxID=393250 RepID=A0ABW5R4M4_9BACL